MLVQTAFQLRQKKVPKPSRNSRGDVAEMLEDIANSIHGWSAGSKKRLEDAMDELSFYDYHQVCTSLMLLKVEIGLGGANSREPDDILSTLWQNVFPSCHLFFFPGAEYYIYIGFHRPNSPEVT